MKRTVVFSKILLIASLLIGCESSDKDSSEPVQNNLVPEPTATATPTPTPTPTATPTPTPAPTANNVVSKLFNNSRGVNSINTHMRFRSMSGSNSTTKMQRRLEKANSQPSTYNCEISGTYTILPAEKEVIVISYSECISSEENKYVYKDGGFGFGNIDGFDVVTFIKYTYISDYENNPETGDYYESVYISSTIQDNKEVVAVDGEIDSYEQGNIVKKLRYYEFGYVEDIQTHDFYITGRTSETFKCFSEDYTYETLKILVPHASNPDYYQSGTIIINGMKYIYNGENVTLSKNGKTSTVQQQEVLEYFEERTSNRDCSNPNQLSKASHPKF